MIIIIKKLSLEFRNKMDLGVNKSKKYLLTIIILSISIIKIKSQVLSLDTYDACAYVGASNRRELPEFCLETDINCCYFAFQWDKDYVYYACVNKQRLIDSVGKKNMTAAFLYESSDDVFPILNNIVYVQCADNKDVIVSPSKMVLPSLDSYQRRRRLTYKSFEEFVEENQKEISEFKRISKIVFNFVSDFFEYIVSFFSSFINNCINL